MAKQTTLQAAQAEVKHLWKLACDSERIPLDSKFVIFSKTNQYATSYNNAARKLFGILNQHRAAVEIDNTMAVAESQMRRSITFPGLDALSKMDRIHRHALKAVQS